MLPAELCDLNRVAAENLLQSFVEVECCVWSDKQQVLTIWPNPLRDARPVQVHLNALPIGVPQPDSRDAILSFGEQDVVWSVRSELFLQVRQVPTETPVSELMLHRIGGPRGPTRPLQLPPLPRKQRYDPHLHLCLRQCLQPHPLQLLVVPQLLLLPE